MKKYSLVLPLVMVTVIFLASLTYGHGAGQALSSQVGDYTIDIDYESFTSEIYINESVRFSFQLWNKDKTEPVEFTGVFVSIKLQQGYNSVFSGQLGIPEFGGVGMSVVFPDPGSYELMARFINKDGTLAEAKFPLTVVGEEKNGITRNLFMAMFVGIIIGIVVGFFFFKKRNVR